MRTTARERIQPLGFPHEVTDPAEFWPLLAGRLATRQSTVVVFLRDGGVVYGYHPSRTARSTAQMVRRKHGVEGVAVLANSKMEMF